MKRYLYSAKYFLPAGLTSRQVFKFSFTSKGQPYVVYLGNDGRKCCLFLSRKLLAKSTVENMIYWEGEDIIWIFNSRSRRTYRVSLQSCSCPDYRYKSNRDRKYQCKHMKGLDQLIHSGKINLEKSEGNGISNKTYGIIKSNQKKDKLMQNVYVSGSPSGGYIVTYPDGSYNTFKTLQPTRVVVKQLIRMNYRCLFLHEDGQKSQIVQSFYISPDSHVSEKRLYSMISATDPSYDSSLTPVIEAEITEALASEYGYSEDDSDAVKALKRLGFRETDFHIDNEFPPEYRGEWQGIEFYSDYPCSLQAMGEGQGWELNLKNCEWDFECWKQLFNQSLETGEAPTSEDINGVFFQEFSDEEITAACDRFTSAKSNQLNRDGQILELILDYAHFEISPEWLKHQLKREFTPSEFTPSFDTNENDMEVIRFWQVGDFIEAFGDEAETLSDISGLALINTTTTAGRIPKSGFPTYAFDRYAAWLAQRGYKAELSPNKNPDILSDEWWREFVGEPATPAPAPTPEPSEPEESEKDEGSGDATEDESAKTSVLASIRNDESEDWEPAPKGSEATAMKAEDAIAQLSAEGQGIDSLINSLRIEKYFDADEEKAAILQQTIDELEAQAQAIQEKIEALYPQFDFEDEKFNLSWRDISSEIERTAPFKKSEHEWVNDKGVSGIITTKHYCISRSQFPSLRPAQLGDRLGIEYGRLKGFAYHCAGKTDGQRFDNSFTEKNIYEFQVERPERGNNWMIEISKWSPTSSDPSPSPKVVPLQPQPATCPSVK
jgi:predicted nucleic acid-binding Zn finger protein